MKQFMLMSGEGYSGFASVVFPVLVNGKEVRLPDGSKRLIVSEAELARIGNFAYQPDEFYQPSENHGLPFDNYAEV